MSLNTAPLEGFRHAFTAWQRCVIAVVRYEAGLKFSRHGGLVGVLLEPIGIVVLVCTVHYFIGGHDAAYGRSIILFYATGILFHFTVQWISMNSKEATRASHIFPLLQDIDFILGAFIVQAMIMFVVFAIVLSSLELFGVYDAIPFAPGGALTAWSLACIFGLSLAILNSVIVVFFRGWRLIYQIFIRLALMISGVFFIPDFLPFVQLRYWLSWMPLLHGVTWFRSSFIPGYPTLLLDKGYFIFSTFFTLTVAFALERATRHRRSRR